jgi:hypothetical protein
VIAGAAEVVRPAGTGENLETLIRSAATAALASAGLERDEIGGIVLAASDQTDGRAISSMLTAGPAGAYLNDEINIASSPGHAFAVAVLSILSGLHERILLTTWGSASESATVGGAEAAERLSFDPYFDRDVLSSLAVAAFQAGAQRSRDGGHDGARALVEQSVANAPRSAGESHLVAHPLASDELAAPLDGAFSLVLSVPSAARTTLAAVQGIGWSTDTGVVSARDLVRLPHLRTAALDAYARAGIDGADAVDGFELHDYTPDAGLLAAEALGLCADGAAPAAAVDGTFTSGGRRPMNLTGGSLAGEAPFGGPLRKVHNVLRQFDEGARRGLAQVAGGVAGQFQTVIVLGGAQ